MGHSDDAYATMLLTMALSPNRDEYARPLSVGEFRRFEAAARASHFRCIGALMDLDISGMMIYLDQTETEAYRAYTLMHRGVQLSYALESFAMQGIDVVTQYDPDYPRRLTDKLGDGAPPFLYRAGTAATLDMPAVAIVGISGVHTSPAARESVENLVRAARRLGYAVIVGGEPGVCRLAENGVAAGGGSLVVALGGDMRAYVAGDPIARMIGEGRAEILSTEHPDALLTVNHAIARNRLVFALADAAFIFNTDGRRGEAEAIQNHTCDWIYAWEGFDGNRPLIARGARPFGTLDAAAIDEASRHWSSSSARQMSMFDML
nr:Putative DNA processing chain A [uncultured bacterium]